MNNHPRYIRTVARVISCLKEYQYPKRGNNVLIAFYQIYFHATKLMDKLIDRQPFVKGKAPVRQKDFGRDIEKRTFEVKSIDIH